MTEDEAQVLATRAISDVTNDRTLRAPLEKTRSLRDLGVSSLMLFDLLSRLEEIGGFTLDDADVDAEHFARVDSLLALLLRQPAPDARTPGKL